MLFSEVFCFSDVDQFSRIIDLYIAFKAPISVSISSLDFNPVYVSETHVFEIFHNDFQCRGTQVIILGTWVHVCNEN